MRSHLAILIFFFFNDDKVYVFSEVWLEKTKSSTGVTISKMIYLYSWQINDVVRVAVCKDISE